MLPRFLYSESSVVKTPYRFAAKRIGKLEKSCFSCFHLFSGSLYKLICNTPNLFSLSMTELFKIFCSTLQLLICHRFLVALDDNINICECIRNNVNTILITNETRFYLISSICISAEDY